MECEDLAERLTDFLEGDLEEPEEAAAIEHLATCSACEVVLADTRSAVELARDHGRAPLSSPDRDRMWDRISDEVAGRENRSR